MSRFRIDHPRVAAVREQFYRNRKRHSHKGRHCRITFDSLFEQFQDEGKTLTQIAKKAGITVSSLQILYERYFMQFCGNKTPQDRRTEYLRRLRNERHATHAADLPNRPWVPALIEQVARAGLSIEPCWGFDDRGRPYILITKMKIGGVECAIHPITGARARQEKRNIRYRPMRFTRAMLETKAHVCPIVIAGWRSCSLIFSSADVEALFPPDQDSINLFIPFMVNAARKRKTGRTFNPWAFENRWDLLVG